MPLSRTDFAPSLKDFSCFIYFLDYRPAKMESRGISVYILSPNTNYSDLILSAGFASAALTVCLPMLKTAANIMITLEKANNPTSKPIW